LFFEFTISSYGSSHSNNRHRHLSVLFRNNCLLQLGTRIRRLEYFCLGNLFLTYRDLYFPELWWLEGGAKHLIEVLNWDVHMFGFLQRITPTPKFRKSANANRKIFKKLLLLLQNVRNTCTKLYLELNNFKQKRLGVGGGHKGKYTPMFPGEVYWRS